MPIRQHIFDWLFYGHLWISLAALALSWQTTFLLTGRGALGSLHIFVFFATLSVYTLHRYLTFRRAGGKAGKQRYALVAKYPRRSLAIGFGSGLVAGALGLSFPLVAFQPLLLALPFTFFYLIPFYPGGPRMRDLPYLKGIWTALAWALVTVAFPGELWSAEFLVRFCFILAIALLFDVRDIALDREQGVKTLAATQPNLNKTIAVTLLAGCALAGLIHSYPVGTRIVLFFGYATAVAFTLTTHGRRGEDFYAVYLNGLLLLPPVLLALLHFARMEFLLVAIL